MTQYIDKAAVVAEIYRLRDFANDRWDIEEMNGVDKFLDKLIPYINSLKVKEVDLDNEITDYINKHYHIRFDETLERGNDPLTTIDFEEIAKHFFELGLKVNNDAVVERACRWIKENITNNPNSNSVLVRNGCVTLGMLVKDFKNYMKGE